MKTYPFLRVHRAGRSVGFTLTELLVVIAIIIILAGILTPSLVSARIQMLRTKCGNNVGEIAKACQGYSQDVTMWRGSGSDDYVLPSASPGKDTSAGLFLLLMRRGSIGRNMFLCPEAELRRDFKAPAEDDTEFVTDGSANTTLSYAYLCQTYTENGVTKYASSPQFLYGGMIILADDNPHLNCGSGPGPDNGSMSNSRNHVSDDEAEGENIADVTGAVKWITDPRVFVRIENGANIKDNIYMNGDDNNGDNGSTSLAGGRSGLKEIFLVP